MPAQLSTRLAAAWTTGIRYPAGVGALSARPASENGDTLCVRLFSGYLDLSAQE
jgi:hypothetical protein